MTDDRIRFTRADRPGQIVSVSRGAALTFAMLDDPRFKYEGWDTGDVELAIVCGRRSLPWLNEPRNYAVPR